jgi:hypothetical protein
MTAHNFSNAPPHAITHYRPAKGFLDAETKTGSRRFVSAKKHSEVGTRTTLSGAVDGIEFTFPHEPRFSRKLQALRITRA